MDHTKKKIKSKIEWDGQNRCAISHIKLTRTSDWKLDGQKPGILFKEDSTSCIGLGNDEKAREKVLLDIGIKTLANLAALRGQTQEINYIFYRKCHLLQEKKQAVSSENLPSRSTLPNAVLAACSMDHPLSLHIFWMLLIPTKLGMKKNGRVRLGNQNFKKNPAVLLTSSNI